MADPTLIRQQTGKDKNVWTETARGYRLARLIDAAEASAFPRGAGVVTASAYWRQRIYRAHNSGYHQFRFFHSVSGAAAQSIEVYAIPHAGPDPIAADAQTLVEWALEPPIWAGTITFGTDAVAVGNIPALNLSGNAHEAVSQTNLHIKDRRVFWDPASGSASGYSVCMFADLSSDEGLVFLSPNGGTYTPGLLPIIGKPVQ